MRCPAQVSCARFLAHLIIIYFIYLFICLLAIYLFPSLRARPPSLFIYLFIFERGYRCTRVHQTPEGPATAQSDGSPASNKPVSYAAPAEQRTAAWARFRPRAERTALQTGEPERDARAQVLHRVLAALVLSAGAIADARALRPIAASGVVSPATTRLFALRGGATAPSFADAVTGRTP